MSEKRTASYAEWLAAHPPPDLQQLVVKYGGDYWNISVEAWDDYQEQMRRWQQERRDRLRW